MIVKFCDLFIVYFFFQPCQTYGGAASQNQNQRCYYYGGPQNKQRVFTSQVPSFSQLTHGRLINEQRIYLNNSNSKWLSIGIVPETKFLGDDASGFHLEVYLGGLNSATLPLGGRNGLFTLWDTIRKIPEFSRIQAVRTGEGGTNILISTTDIGGGEVSTFFIFLYM